MGILKFLIGCHVFRVGNLAVECHYWSERISFGNQPQFTRRKVVIFAVSVHFLFRNRLEVILVEVFSSHFHDESPDGFSVVKYFAILLLLLSTVEEAAQ